MDRTIEAQLRKRIEQLETIVRASSAGTAGQRWCICVDPENCNPREMLNSPRACRQACLISKV